MTHKPAEGQMPAPTPAHGQRLTYPQACRQNAPAATCEDCYRPMRYTRPQVCDSCYDDRSRSGQLLTRLITTKEETTP